MAKIFNTKADLVAASLTAGQLTSTKGYTTAGDGGGATYLIKTAVDYAGTPDEYGDHTLAGGTIAVLQTEGSVNVKLFGATGDNTTDDTLAIQAAIAKCRATNQMLLHCPRGFYRISATLNVSGISVKGDGVFATRFIALNGFTGTELLLIDSATTGGSAGQKYSGFQVEGSRSFSSDVLDGMRLKGDVLHNVFENLKISECKAFAIKIEGDDDTTTTQRPSVNTFTNLRLIENDKSALLVKAGRSNTFIDCDFELCGETCIRIEGQNASESPTNIQFVGGWVEGAGTGFDAINLSQSVNCTFRNMNITTYGDATGTTGHGFDLQNSNYVVIENCTIGANRSGASTATSVKINSSGGRWCRVINTPSDFVFPTDFIDVSPYFINFIGANTGDYGNKHYMVQSNGSSIATGSSGNYVQPYTGVISTSALVDITYTISNRMTLTNFHATTKQLPGGTESYRIMFYKNGALSHDFFLTDANSGEDSNSTTVTLDIGDTIGFRIISSASAASVAVGQIQITCAFL